MHRWRGGTGAALELVAAHAVATTDVAFGHRAGSGAVQRGQCVGLRHVLAVDVVVPAVISLGHYGHGPQVLARPDRRVVPDRPANGRMVDDADAVGVGDADGAEEVTRVLDPVGARHLAIAIEAVDAGPYRLGLGVVAPWQDGRDSGLDRLAVSGLAVQRCVTDQYARHVGDGIEQPGFSGKRQAEFTTAWFRHDLRLRG